MDNIYQNFAKEIRKISLQIVHNADSSHIGGSLSMADILSVLYTNVINIDPVKDNNPERDRFILSKGHCCASLYATLALKGFFPLEELIKEYGVNGTGYFTHVSHYLSGIELSSGSLGHGLPVACGMAIAGKHSKLNFRVFCLVGDGELDEGSNWESIMFAAQYKLNNLCLIVDYNKIQSLGNVTDIINLEPLKAKFEAFNWNTITIDGHDYYEIEGAFSGANSYTEGPTVIIANTVKGKGVSYMENELKWHYKSPNNVQLKEALEEL